MKEVRAAVVMIGNELLSGRTQETNFKEIAQAFAQKGVTICEGRILADDEDAIVAVVRKMSAAYDYVVTTGGIGPTHDDITSSCLAKAFNAPLILHEEAHQLLRTHYGARLNEARLKMAHIPQGATLIDNPVSLAPGFRIRNVFVLAGVPVIMKAMLPYVLRDITGGDIKAVVTISAELAEGELAEGLAMVAKTFPRVEIGSYPWFKSTSLGVHLVLRSFDKKELKKCEDEIHALIKCIELS